LAALASASLKYHESEQFFFLPKAWEASQSITPPNEENCERVDNAILLSVLISTKPEPAAVDEAGAPM
jgi:hypothetical protein